MTAPKLTALILAGGSSTRMGQDKASLLVGGRTLLHRTVTAAAARTEHVIVSGPELPLGGERVMWSQEDPPRGGPVAALAAAAPLVTTDWVMMLPCDLAHPKPAINTLLSAAQKDLFGADAYVARDEENRTQWLTGLVRHRALTSALDELGTVDAPVRALFSDLSVFAVDAPDEFPGVWEDMDTPDDIALATKDMP